MRLLHIIHQYFPDHVGGTEHYVRSLTQAQQEMGHEVAIFCRQDGTGRSLERDRSEETITYRATHGSFTPGRRFRSTLSDQYLADCLTQVIQEIRPDLIHIHHLMGLPLSTLRRISPPLPLVVTLHDYWWVCANAQLITNYDGQVCDGPRWWINCARCALARGGAQSAWPLAPIVAPLVDGRRGNPVLFDRSTFPELLALTGDVGGRALFSRYPIEWLPWLDAAVLLDVDTPDEYRKLLAG